MERLRKWAIDKPPMLFWFALAAVKFARDGRQYSTILNSGAHLEKLKPVPTIKVWLGLYRDHRKVMRGAIAGFFGINYGRAQQIENAVDEFRKFTRLKPDEQLAAINAAPDEFKATVAAALKACETENKTVFDELEQDVNDQPTAAEKAAMRRLGDPRVQFLFRVVLPCWLYCGDFPTRVFHRARTGDLASLEALLRIDKSIVADKKIAHQINLAVATSRRGLFRRIAIAFGAFPKVLKHRQVKVNIAAMISKFAAGVGRKLTATEITELFDAVASAYKKKSFAPDTDIPAGDTLTREIHMQRKRWRIMPDPEKNHP